MDLTFILSAAIFTLLAIVIATSLLNGSSSSGQYAKAQRYFGHRGDASGSGLDQPGPKQNGYVPDKKMKKKAEDDWCEISGSSHDHWDVVKSVLSKVFNLDKTGPKRAKYEKVNLYNTPVPTVGQISIQERCEIQEEAHSHPRTEKLATPVEHSSSTTMSLEVDSSSEASSGRSHRSFIGLSDKELLKCAFSHPQTEGATESPEVKDLVESNEDNSLKYVPGKARTHHLEMMMSKEELEEEQRVQREQLAAIFQLLQDNKETFGEVSEGDMEEQFRLYSI